MQVFATFAIGAIATIASGEPADSPDDTKEPQIADLKVKGEQWTCTADGESMSGVLLKPAGDGPFPAIILSHGLGGNAEGIALSKGPELVQWGFVCIATDYTHAGAGRRASGQQQGGRPAGISGDFSKFGARPENIRRALVCLKVLQQQDYVDPQRIAAYGHSMGAFVTIALTAAAPDAFAAVAITSGGVQIPTGHTQAAPAADVASRIRAPFLILHGADDTTVPPESSEVLRREFERNQVPVQRHVFEGVGHRVPSDRAEDCLRLMREWFTKHAVLKSEKGIVKPP